MSSRRRSSSLEERLRRQREIAAYPPATAEQLAEVVNFCRAPEQPLAVGHSQAALDAWGIQHHGSSVSGRQYFVTNSRLLLYLALTLKDGKPLAIPRHPLAPQILRHLLFEEADAGCDPELHAS